MIRRGTNPCTEDDLRKGGSIQDVLSISPALVQRAMYYVFLGRDACLQAKGNRFHDFLQT